MGRCSIDIRRDDPRPRIGHRMSDSFADPRAAAGNQRQSTIE
jgi:hypothetical protein